MHLHMQCGFHPAGGSSFHTTFSTASFAVKISGRVVAFASFLSFTPYVIMEVYISDLTYIFLNPK